MKNIVYLISLIAFIGCQTNDLAPNTYELTVRLEGMEDNTLIILQEPKGTIIDSARLKNKEVIFSGKLEDTVQWVLRSDKRLNYKYIWMEPNRIQLMSKTNQFKESMITGSFTQTQSDALSKRIKPFEDIMDNVDSYAEENQEKLTRKIADSLLAIYNKAEKDEELETQKFISENANYTYAAHLLDFYKTTYGKEIVSDIYAKFSNRLKQGAYGQSIEHFLKINDEPKLGDLYKDITLANRNEELKSLSKIKGQYTLIEFWASNCAPCRTTNPKLVKIYNKYQSKGFEIFGISLDTNKNSWLEALNKDGLPWTNVVDLEGHDGNTALTYGINALPTNYLMDADGKIIAKKIWSEDLDELLSKLLP